MDSLPYVDTLFKEYLLFRGFTTTLQSFAAELAADRCCGFQAEALCELIFGQLLPQCRTKQLMELLELLADRLYSQLDGRFEGMVERMEMALIKATLVTCVRMGKQDKVSEFFRQYGDSLLSGPEAGVWRQWAALAFVPTPRKDPAFQAYFNPEWLSLLEVSFRNFLSQAMAALPLPAVLRFNVDRRHRLALQQQVDSLQRQVEALAQQLVAAQAAAEAAQVQGQGQQAIGDSNTGAAGTGPTVEVATPPADGEDSSSLSGGGGNVATAPSHAGGGVNGALVPTAQGQGHVRQESARDQGLQTVPQHASQPPVGRGDVRQSELPQGSVPGPNGKAPARSTAVGAGAGAPPGALPLPLPQQSQPKPAGHHQHHHVRTLSLEAWHSINAEEVQAPAAAVATAAAPRNGTAATNAADAVPGTFPEAGAAGGDCAIATSRPRHPPARHIGAGSGCDSGADDGVGSNEPVDGLSSRPQATSTAATRRDGGESTAAVAIAATVTVLGPPSATSGSPQPRVPLPSVAEDDQERLPPPEPQPPLSPEPAASQLAATTTGAMTVPLPVPRVGSPPAVASVSSAASLAAGSAASTGAAGPRAAPVVAAAGSFAKKTGREAGEEASDQDEEEEDDPAVMLVAGPAERESHVASSRRRRQRGRTEPCLAAGTSGSGDDEDGDEDDRTSDGADDGSGDGSEHHHDDDSGDLDDEDEEEEGSIDEDALCHASVGSSVATVAETGVGAERALSPRRSALSVPPPAAAAAAASVCAGGGGGSSSSAGSSLLMHRAASVVVGGGRWQGVATYGAQPGALHGRGGAVLAAQFSPGSGHNVATGAADGSVAIWAPGGSVGGGGSATGLTQGSNSPREARLSCDAPVTCIAWDARADKVMLVGTARRGILAWHADTRRVSAEIAPDPTAPWVSQLACSRKDPVFIVAAATGPPPGFGTAAAAAAAAAAAGGSGGRVIGRSGPVAAAPTPAGAGPPVQRVLSHAHPSQHNQQQPPASGAAAAGGSAGSGSSSSMTTGGGGSGSCCGRLSLWNMRAFKRVSYYVVPQDSPVLSLAFNAQGSWFAAGTSCGVVHLYDSSSSGSRAQPLSTFRANAPPSSSSAPAASAPAAVQVYDSSSETVLVTCCGATVRLWSLRRLVEPLLSLPLLPYLPYGGAGGGWSPDWAPSMCLSPRGAAAAVVLGGGSPAVYLVDLQGGGGGAGGSQSEDGTGGGGGVNWRSGVFGSPTTSSTSTSATKAALTAAAACRVSVILPYCGDGGGVGGGGGLYQGTTAATGRGFDDGLHWRAGGSRTSYGYTDDDAVYGTSCSWHPTRDVVVVGYNDGAVQTVGLTRGAGG